MKWYGWFCLFVCGMLLCGCNSHVTDEAGGAGTKMVSLACWNAQTFFDAEVEGTEYTDYQNMSKWSRGKYLTRLSRLREVMTALDADVFVLEEIENLAVVQDISNQLSGGSWDKKKCWSYCAFLRAKGSSIGCAVFSRYELKNVKAHCLEICTQKEVQPEMRPLMQVTVDVDGQELLLFVNHWKSKLGGVSSEIWRDWQESVLTDTVLKLRGGNEHLVTVACGDFNRDASEFVCNFSDSDDNLILRGKQNIGFYCPWFNDSGSYVTDVGSYYYEDNWERIDNIMVSGSVKLSAFGPKTEGNWAGGKSIPNSYKLYSGEGYSDHLPLMCVMSLL